MTKLHELNDAGQSLWLDYIRRSFIANGELQALVDEGVTGVTSNPTIFEKAIVDSDDYDDELRQLVDGDMDDSAIYERLAVADIQSAADVLRPVYDRTDGADGYVSLEVSPDLADNTDETIAAARRLFATVDRPNVMIKIPATSAGLPAITNVIGAGINVNVTLIFSLEQYEQVTDAYLKGLEELAAAQRDLSSVASVASFFVSRVDGKVDAALDERGNSDLKGTIAIANAKVAYERFKQIFSGPRWEPLAAKGARVQRPLWASTGAKDPAYPETMYVDELIGPHTVNTVPPDTLDAFRDKGTVAATLESGMDNAHAQLKQLADLGIDLAAITAELQEEGVEKFASSFASLMGGLAEKRQRMQHAPTSGSGDGDGSDENHGHDGLAQYQDAIDDALADLRNNTVLARMWQHDNTVWQDDPTEVSNRLGWLHSPKIMRQTLDDIKRIVDDVRNDGYTHALLLGMGGSSLAPDVFRQTFDTADGYLELNVLDSTDADAVRAYDRELDPAKTLFIVSTKSGGTVETFSFFKYFYNRTLEAVGKAEAGRHFIAITDPESSLIDTAKRYAFRTVFVNDPNIGGRYSALSFFGLVPAALSGVDVTKLLDRAQAMADSPAEDNTGLWLGTVMGETAVTGRDKITIIASPPIASYGAWAEQLIAESMGKEGKGIVPVADEPLGAPDVYGDDRLFAYLRLDGDNTHDAGIEALRKAGQSVVQFDWRDHYDVAGEMFRWEVATAIAGRLLSINPFDQPNVESAKKLARAMVETYQREGELPKQTPSLEADGIAVYSDVGAPSIKEAFENFMAQAKPGDYISIQAYVTPNEATTSAFQDMRVRLRDTTKLATTFGYGPRFLHSTGQLHKGDNGNGLFIQFTSDPNEDAAIPDEAGSDESAMSFGVLKLAQALGDRQALLDNDRRVIRFHLGKDVLGGLRKLDVE